MARRSRGPTLIQKSRSIAPGQKALWHHVLGAGKSRIKREFFDLNAEDLDVLAVELGRRMEQRLHQTR